MKTLKWAVTVAAVLCLGLLPGPNLCLASTINVPSEGNSSIQSAIDHAVNGDTVLVSNGTYHERINFNGKAITVRSVNGASVTTINGDASGTVVTFNHSESNNSVLSGFTVKNGLTKIDFFVVGDSSDGYGGGIYCDGSSPTITNCNINGNTADSGGGIYCNYSSPIITNCTISGNTALHGGGIYCESSSPTITNCTISGNTANQGISCTINPYCSWVNGAGGGIYCSASSPIMANCIISNNTAYDGGGVYCESSSLTITNCTISGNTATIGYYFSTSSGRGGGIYCVDSSSINITNCTISGNTAQSWPCNWGFVGGGYGGGIYCGSSSLTITNCTLSGNTAQSCYSFYTAGGYGSGIYFDESSLVVLNSILWGDTGVWRSANNWNPSELYSPGGSISVTYSDIQGGYTGIGNIDADPKFVGDGDYHLTGDSPCINTGIYTNRVTDDIDGDARPHYNSYDMGVDEYTGEICGDGVDNDGDGKVDEGCDYDGDGLPDDWEYRYFGGLSQSPTGDYDHDGYSNLAEYKRGCDPTVAARTINVPADYSTIQAAIDAAACGDTIKVAAGVYYENIDFTGKSINVEGSGADTVIDGRNSGPVVTFASGENQYTVLDGFAIRNGSGTDGGGVIVRNGAAPYIVNNIIYSNRADYGGGIYCEGSSPVIMNNTITDNTAPSDGDGIVAADNASPTVTNCIIWSNGTEEIFLYASSITVTYSDIKNGYIGSGNISDNPLFTDAAGRDYHLRGDSPCIDRGTDSHAPAEDVDRQERPMLGRYDMGADERVFKIKTEDTPAGTGAEVTIFGNVITFDNITSPGVTTLTVSENGISLPGNFKLLGAYYHIETTALYSGNIEVCFTYDDTGLTAGEEQSLHLLHYKNGKWQNVAPVSVDIHSNRICGQVTSFSEFAIAAAVVKAGGDDSGGDSRCFIATAAFGTPFAQEVQTLRRFRDAYLLTNTVGQEFVSLYYRLSPPVADFIRDNSVLRAVVRTLLRPIVWLAQNLLPPSAETGNAVSRQQPPLPNP